jgi:hypothetical protein
VLGGHLQREDGDARPLTNGGVAGDVQGQARLTEAGPCSEDHEVRALEAAEQLVKIGEAGLDRAAGLVLLADLLEVAGEQFLDVNEVFDRVGAADAEQETFGLAENLIDVGTALVGLLGDLPGGGDEVSVNGVAGDDAGEVGSSVTS